MANKVYTKTGDKGETSLIGGTRVKKNNIRIEAYGTVDELNSWIGLLRDSLPETQRNQELLLIEIQDRLFTMGSNLANDLARSKMELPTLNEGDVQLLEEKIDFMEKELPEMKHFILPGGHPLVSKIHIARCVCRRAERSVISIEEPLSNAEIIIKYLNRLSDYLFVLSRWMAFKLNIKETPWLPRK